MAEIIRVHASRRGTGSGLTIHQRPFQPEDRSQPGQEGDLIIGKGQGSAIGTLVERQTRMIRLMHLPQRDGDILQRR